MNDQNLVPLNKRPKSEQREIQRQGGKARGAQRREHKTIAEMLRKVLDEALPGDPSKTRGEAIVESIAGRTFKGGKAADLKILAEVLGEQVQKVEHTGIPTPVVVASQETADHLDNLRNKGKK